MIKNKCKVIHFLTVKKAKMQDQIVKTFISLSKTLKLRHIYSREFSSTVSCFPKSLALNKILSFLPFLCFLSSLPFLPSFPPFLSSLPFLLSFPSHRREKLTSSSAHKNTSKSKIPDGN